MITRLLILTLGWIFISANIPEHAIYISVLELNREATSTTATLSVKVFSDDLQDVIRNYEANYIRKSTDQFVEANKLVITDYFRTNLNLRINGKTTNLRFQKSEMEGGAYFIYFLMDAEGPWRKLDLNGDYFSELFPEQSNILKVNSGQKKFHTRLTKSSPSYAITFD
jgi:hypothetical protein